MAEDTGFLERLTGSSVDERVIARDRIKQAIANPQSGNAGLRQMFYGLGQQATGGLGAAARGLGTGVLGRREGEGFLEATGRGVQEAQDSLTAQAVGITPNELRTRRRIRQEVAKAKGGETPQNKLALAKRAAQIAADNGDGASLARALSSIKNIKTEMEEFGKLQAQRKQEEAAADAAGIRDIWVEGESTPRTAQLVPEGAVITNAQGEPQTIPIGQFSLNDPRGPVGLKDEPFAEQYRKLVPSAVRAQIGNTIVAAKDGVRTFRRVLNSVRDWADLGDAQTIISSSGKALSFIDNITRNVMGFARAFAIDDQGRRGFEREGTGEFVSVDREYQDLVRGGIDKYNILLPEGVQRASSAAQNYQAQLINLAYAVARMREPSNRGLSDNDVQLALDSLTVNGSNPQVIFRRFTEMIGDAAASIDDIIGVWDGQFQDQMTPKEFREKVGGSTLEQYDKDLKVFFSDIGAAIDETGRAVFERELDADIAPNEGITHKNTSDPNEDLSDQEFLDHLIGTGSQ